MSLNKYTQLSYEERVIIENRLKNNVQAKHTYENFLTK